MLSFMFPIFLISKLVTFLIFSQAGFLSYGKTETGAFPNYSIIEIRGKILTDLIFTPHLIFPFVFIPGSCL